MLHFDVTVVTGYSQLTCPARWYDASTMVDTPSVVTGLLERLITYYRAAPAETEHLSNIKFAPIVPHATDGLG